MTKNLENIFLRLDCFGPDARVKPSSVETHATFTPDSLKKEHKQQAGLSSERKHLYARQNNNNNTRTQNVLLGVSENP